ncbi:MAG: DUF2156 domain-containing protein [Clostridiaceae bacterium]|nr:DUF2156 domain-containing protein [Clostridiaceae bacterium]
MVSFKPISLDDKDLFTDIFAKSKPKASEMSFAYLFMWECEYNLLYAIVEDHLCMISRPRNFKPFAFCPIPVDGVRNDEKFKRALTVIEEYFKNNGMDLLFGRVEESRLEELKQVYGSRMEAEYLEDISDYVYETSNLINLPGKKLRKKKNHINQFMRLYGSYEYVPVDKSNVEECRRIFDEWCEKNHECKAKISCERAACNRLLDNWDVLPLKGALIKVNGKFEAFTIGELLNPDMAVIHIEKGNSDIHGVYPLINRDFCANEWSGVKYINREEDMGIEGIRKSKLSYNPDFMVKKFLVKVSH